MWKLKHREMRCLPKVPTASKKWSHIHTQAFWHQSPSHFPNIQGTWPFPASGLEVARAAQVPPSPVLVQHIAGAQKMSAKMK